MSSGTPSFRPPVQPAPPEEAGGLGLAVHLCPLGKFFVLVSGLGKWKEELMMEGQKALTDRPTWLLRRGSLVGPGAH